MKQYIFNLETTKIELHFEKSEYNALTAEQKADLKKCVSVEPHRGLLGQQGQGTELVESETGSGQTGFH